MIKLSKRLMAVAALVQPGAAVADIGTDHGFIPVFLAESGIIKSAVASDIHKAPLDSCKRLVEERGLGNIIKTRISDGLDKIDDNECDTIIIAGMGGELIAQILSKCSWAEKKHIILQPMTHPETARKFLYDNGFEIDSDLIVKDGRHYYSVFDAHYTGEIQEKKRADYFLGNITDFTNKKYFSHLLNYFINKSKSGEDYSDIILALERLL